MSFYNPSAALRALACVGLRGAEPCLRGLRRGRHSSLKHRANICFFPDTDNAFYTSRTMQNNLIPNNYDARPARQAGNDGGGQAGNDVEV